MDKISQNILQELVTGSPTREQQRAALEILKGITKASDPSLSDRLISQAEAARLLGVSRWTVHRMANDGELEKVMVRQSVRHRLSDIRKIMGGTK